MSPPLVGQWTTVQYVAGVPMPVLPADQAEPVPAELLPVMQSIATWLKEIDNAASNATAGAAYLEAMASAAAASLIFGTYAQASAALSTIPANAFIQILGDETRGNRWDSYQKLSGALSYVGAFDSTPTTWWIDPTNASGTASDSNNGTSAASAFLTFAKIATVLEPGDTIRGYPNIGTTLVKENVNLSTFNYVTMLIPGFLFMAYDAVAPTWTSVGSGVWVATINLTIGSGGTAAHDIATAKTYPGLFGGGINYNQVDANGTLSESQAIAALLAAGPNSYVVTGGPVVGGTPSGRTYGFVWGNHSFYVYPANGANPNSLSWASQNRIQPALGKGWTLSGFMVFGGYNSDGFTAQYPDLLGRIEILWCSNHGCIIPGAQGIGPILRYKNQTGAAGYGIHMFNGGARIRRCYLQNPQFYNWGNDILDNCFGGHGSGQPNDIIEILEVDDLYAENVWGVGDCPNTTFGNIFRRPKIRGCHATGWENNTSVISGEIIHIGLNTESCFTIPNPGCIVNVSDTVVSGNTVGVFLLGASSQTGTLNFNSLRAIVGGEQTNGIWWSTDAGAVNFANGCLIQGEGGSDAGFTWYSVNNGTTVTFTDSAIAGVTPPSGATFVRTQQGGNLGLLRGLAGQPAVIDMDNLSHSLGEIVIGAATPPNFGTVYLLTNFGMYLVAGTNVSWAQPQWTALNAYALNGICGAYKLFTGTWVIAYGPNSTILRYNTNDAASAFPTVADTSAVPGKNIVGAIFNGSDGVIALGCSDGTIILYDASSNTVTTTTSGAAYPILDGYRSGAQILACGSDALGTTATIGGARFSTNSGTSWASVLASGDTVPTGIGAWAIRVRCGGQVNGIWVLLGSRGTFLFGYVGGAATASISATTMTVAVASPGQFGAGASLTGAAGTIVKQLTSTEPGGQLGGAGTYQVSTSQTVASSTITASPIWTPVGVGSDVDIRTIAIDNTNNRIVWGGDAGLAPYYRGTFIGYIDCANVDPTTWHSIAIDPPVAAVGPKIVCTPPIAVGPNNLVQWVISGRIAEVAIGEDPRFGYRKSNWPRPNPTYVDDYLQDTALMLSFA